MFGYDPINKTLNFAVDFFGQQPEAVLRVKWSATIKKGASVAPGVRLGAVIFNDGSELDMIVPPQVTGLVASVNRKIEYEFLDQHPAQFAMRLG
jgi:hypothetical protein